MSQIFLELWDSATLYIDQSNSFLGVASVLFTTLDVPNATFRKGVAQKGFTALTRCIIGIRNDIKRIFHYEILKSCCT